MQRCLVSTTSSMQRNVCGFITSLLHLPGGNRSCWFAEKFLDSDIVWYVAEGLVGGVDEGKQSAADALIEVYIHLLKCAPKHSKYGRFGCAFDTILSILKQSCVPRADGVSSTPNDVTRRELVASKCVLFLRLYSEHCDTTAPNLISLLSALRSPGIVEYITYDISSSVISDTLIALAKLFATVSSHNRQAQHVVAFYMDTIGRLAFAESAHDEYVGALCIAIQAAAASIKRLQANTAPQSYPDFTKEEDIPHRLHNECLGMCLAVCCTQKLRVALNGKFFAMLDAVLDIDRVLAASLGLRLLQSNFVSEYLNWLHGSAKDSRASDETSRCVLRVIAKVLNVCHCACFTIAPGALPRKELFPVLESCCERLKVASRPIDSISNRCALSLLCVSSLRATSEQRESMCDTLAAYISHITVRDTNRSVDLALLRVAFATLTVIWRSEPAKYEVLAAHRGIREHAKALLVSCNACTLLDASLMPVVVSPGEMVKFLVSLAASSPHKGDDALDKWVFSAFQSFTLSCDETESLFVSILSNATSSTLKWLFSHVGPAMLVPAMEKATIDNDERRLLTLKALLCSAFQSGTASHPIFNLKTCSMHTMDAILRCMEMFWASASGPGPGATVELLASDYELLLSTISGLGAMGTLSMKDGSTLRVEVHQFNVINAIGIDLLHCMTQGSGTTLRATARAALQHFVTSMSNVPTGLRTDSDCSLWAAHSVFTVVLFLAQLETNAHSVEMRQVAPFNVPATLSSPAAIADTFIRFHINSFDPSSLANLKMPSAMKLSKVACEALNTFFNIRSLDGAPALDSAALRIQEVFALRTLTDVALSSMGDCGAWMAKPVLSILLERNAEGA